MPYNNKKQHMNRFFVLCKQMDEMEVKARQVLATLGDFFNEHPPELQWSRDAQLLVSVQV